VTRRAWLLAVGLVLGGLGAGRAGGQGRLHVVVADLPLAQVWAAALRAVVGYPLEQAAGGVIVTRRAERPPEAGESAYTRIAERVVLRVEAFGERVTRVTIEVEAEGLRDGTWVALPDVAGRAQRIAERIRDAQG
jgi:hypothetical protein